MLQIRMGNRDNKGIISYILLKELVGEELFFSEILLIHAMLLLIIFL